MAKKSKAIRQMEYYKQKYLEYLAQVESEEEQRLAVEHQPRVNVNNVMHWSVYLQGARAAFRMMHENYRAKKGEDAIYTDAIFKLITSDLRYTGMFMTQSNEIYFRNHKKDNKGKLVSVEAYFAEKVTIIKEV